MIDYITNAQGTELYKIYRYMDGQICTDIRLIDTYKLTDESVFIEFNANAFWATATR
jgi:hypothetical protein